MYYRDDSEDYNEKINTDSNHNYDEEDYAYEELFKNMPYNRQQIPYAPNYYGMIPSYPMMWNMQTLKNYDNNYRNKGENLEQNMPMKHMKVSKEEDEDLKMLYPKIYISIYPMVKHHCDRMVAMYGKMYCPSKDEMDYISKEIYEKHEKHYRDDEEDENFYGDEYSRQRRRFHRRRGNQDLIKILLINELLGRRHGGGYWW